MANNVNASAIDMAFTSSPFFQPRISFGVTENTYTSIGITYSDEKLIKSDMVLQLLHHHLGQFFRSINSKVY
jgi:hypothetical protein